MATEHVFENEFVIEHFTNPKGLDYERINSGEFNSTWLLVPRVIKDYLLLNYKNSYDTIIKYDFQGDEKAFLNAFCEELSEFIFSKVNVAIALNPQKYSFDFRGNNFEMFKPFLSKDDDKNLYGVMNQFSLSFKSNNKNINLRPDIGIFVNGILFSYIELKMLHKGQSAKVDGRKKIIGDYMGIVKSCVVDVIEKQKLNDEETETVEEQKRPLRPLHKLVHLISLDTNEGYILRNIEKHFQTVKKHFAYDTLTEQQVKDEILSTFYIDALYTKEKNLSVEDRTKKFLSSLYAKERIQDEIWYLNFLAYDKYSTVDNRTGKRGQKIVKNKNNQSYLVHPRPNQKYALNKVIEDVQFKYINEHIPDFEINKLRQRLELDNIPEELIVKELEKRDVYTNNKNQFSLLLQYSAGFGKTYIICWLAAMLKDLYLHNDKHIHLFDKVLLISDRLELRDQTDLAMHNMNIDRTLFQEADTKDKLKAYLTDKTTRIIVVNIQKFPFVQEVLNGKEKSILQDKRIAFLIDEVHRSNSGEQNRSMLNIFDEISSAKTGTQKKKNLVIGLTATPSDDILARYGEYQSCKEHIKWLPFDYYTMKDAIADGFVLNPLKGLVPFSVQLEYDSSDDTKIAPSNSIIYENDDRIFKISDAITDTLLKVTYPKIRNTGKAMLACYSINSAIKYFHIIKKLLEKKTQSPEFQKYQDTRVYIVYTSSQGMTSATEMSSYNGKIFGTEKDIIGDFKSSKNGIVIVVDKLQTGFDEPKLHTLFLDKEINGINAVQTLCRVNRTTKWKNDCLVVDCSINNVNIQNIQNAFAKFEGLVSSDLDTYGVKEDLEYLYKKITFSEIYNKFYKRFKANPNDISLATDINNYINAKLGDEGLKIYLIEHMKMILSYIRSIKLIDGIIELDTKYTNVSLIKFLQEFVRTVKTIKQITSDDEQDVADFVVLDSGEIILNVIPEIIQPSIKTKSSFSIKDDEYISTSNLEELNLLEDEKAEFINNFKSNIESFSLLIMDKDRTDLNNAGLFRIQTLNPEQYSNEEREQQFLKLFNAVERRIKSLNPDLVDFVKAIKPIISMIEKDFYHYVNKNGWQ